MKQFLIILLVLGLCGAQPTYRVKDLSGRTICDTKDTALIHQLANVKVDTLPDTIRVAKLRDSSYCDNLKEILEKSLGKATSEMYQATWILEGGGEIQLNKYLKKSPLIRYNTGGKAWLKQQVIGLFEVQIEPVADTSKP